MNKKNQYFLNEGFQSSFNLACVSQATVLLTGATGTGKTTLARQIHRRSDRRSGPFVAINLATLHEGTLESELFGHERGAFTGADTKRKGGVEEASGGTLFLDEIGELSLKLQARLLELLQSKTIRAVGSNQSRRVDVRVIAATHCQLSDAVKNGTFREDLFHRLRVIPIHLKNLSERTEEFDSIVHELLASLCKTHQKSIKRISEQVASAIEAYSWPGNIRELQNVLEYGVLSCFGEVLEWAHLPEWFQTACRLDSVDSDGGASGPVLETIRLPLSLNYYENLSRFEKIYIIKMLSRFRGRINLTARQTGMSKTTLIRRMRTYGIGSGVA